MMNNIDALKIVSLNMIDLNHLKHSVSFPNNTKTNTLSSSIRHKQHKTNTLSSSIRHKQHKDKYVIK